jgi:DNA-binding MarR family transcriptional regulator
MKMIIHQLEQYIREALGIVVVPRAWEKSRGLPQYLRESYSFAKIDVLGRECLLMVDSGEAEQTPAVIGKHLGQVRARCNIEAVYVCQTIASYNRKRLIGQKVPFIIPGNQMYLPMLGIDLREHLKRLRQKKTLFSPSTQLLILHVLWRKEAGTVTPAEIANRLGYSAMTMTRAFDELESAGIGEHSVRGKERHLHFSEAGRPLWEHVLPYLGTPVRRRLYVDASLQKEKGSLAGQSALAFYTMLAEPKVAVLAFPVAEWKVKLREEKIIKLTSPEPGDCEIELWKYPPAQFADNGRVDRLSLFLSLKDNTDERVQSALDELLGDMKW